jgi:hypothetical protein
MVPKLLLPVITTAPGLVCLLLLTQQTIVVVDGSLQSQKDALFGNWSKCVVEFVF